VDEPWVILAKVDVADKTIVEKDIDNVSYRRYVVSFGSYWFTCGMPAPPAQLLKVENVILRLTQAGAPNVEALNLKSSGASFPLAAPVPTTIDVINEIEVIFNAPPDVASVKDGETVIVRDGTGAILEAKSLDVDQVSARWRPSEVIRPPFTIQLRGSGAATITLNTLPLDGEPAQLPSGDGTPGGDFLLEVAPSHQ